MRRSVIAILPVLVVASFAVGVPKIQNASQPRTSVELRLAENQYASGLSEASLAGSGTKVYLHREVLVTARDILRCRPFPNAPGHFVDAFAFTSDAAKRIAEATKGQDKKLVALLVNGDLIAVQPVNNIDRYCAFDRASKEEAESVAKSVGGAILESLIDDRGQVTVEIRLCQRSPAEGLVEAQDSMTLQEVYLSQEPIIGNKDIIGARVVNGYMEGIFNVELTLTQHAAQQFSRLPETNMGAMIAEVVGGRIVSTGYVVGELGARPQISGDFDKEEAELIANAVNRR